MRTIGFTVLLWLVTPLVSHASPSSPGLGLEFVSPKLAAGLPIELNGSLIVDPSLSGQLGGALKAAYHWRHVALDARLTYEHAPFGEIDADPDLPADSTGFDSATDPSSELNRVRLDDDPWSFLLFEPGVSAGGRLFSSFLPMLTQRARFGLARGSMTDQDHAIDFTAWLYSVEAGVQYHFGPKSPFSLDLAVTRYAGVLSSGEKGRTSQQGRLPVTWVSCLIGFSYWL